jgi:uncharacterized repeat protein (TIGR02543 family)
MLVVVLMILPIIGFSVQASEGGARIWTDKEEYVSHETVTIFGSGFLANSKVIIMVATPDLSVSTIYIWTDEFGVFVAYYILDGMEGTYTVTATDGTNTATTTFLEPPSVDAVWSDSDCASIKATASGLTASKSYYVTYADPDGVVRRTSPTYTGVSSFTDYFVLDIALPKVLGTWTVRLYEMPATLKKTDTVTIDKMVWTTDSTYATMKTSFAQGETVYFKAIGLLTSKYYRFRLDPPAGSSIYVGAWTTGVTTLTGSYVLPANAPTGSWKLHVRQADDAAGGGEKHYVDRYFTVTEYVPPPTATVTFSQVGVGSDFTGPVLKVDGVNYTVADLPKDFTWVVGSEHTFAFYSHFVVNGKRYVWTRTEGLSTEQSGTIIVPVNGGAVIGYYKTQFYLTVVSPYGTPGGEGWYDKDSTAYATVTPLIVPGPVGVRYVFTGWGGDAKGTTSPSDPIIMDAPKTAIANWKTEYQLTVRTSGLGTYTTSVYHGTTILGTATDAAPYTGWFEEGSLILLNVDSPIVDGSKRFVFTQWSGDAAGTSRPVSLTMNSPKDVTASYKTQYQITVTASPSGALGGTFKVTYTQCGTTYSNVQKTTPWTEWADAGTTVTVSEPQDIVNGYKFDHYDPSQSVTMTTAKTITLVYREISPLSVSISPLKAKIKIGESVTFTSSVSGGLSPYSYQWYLNGSAVSGATSSTWTFTPTATGYYIVYLKVTDGTPQTVKSNEASVTAASPLAVSISPMSASIVVGQSVAFTSTVSGGYPPYSYQWYLNNVAVSGATSSGWTFTPTSSGIYYVYLKVVDSNNNVVQSEAAKVSVASVPVGGYSISLVKQTPLSSLVAYAFVIVLSAAALGLAKRGRKFL